MGLTTVHYLVLALLFLMSIFWYVRRRQVVEVEPIRSILDLAAIPSLRNATPQLNLEVARARRLTHSLSVIVIHGDFTTEHEGEQDSNVKSLNNQSRREKQVRQLDLQGFSDCSRAFRDQLREVDCIAFDSVRDQFIVVLPGSERLQAIETMDRLNRYLGPQIANQLVMGVAEYPRDGLFLEDLIEYSMEQIAGNSASSDQGVEVSA